MLKILLLIVSVVVILLSLLQSGKQDGITGAFSGSKNIVVNQKERGPEKTISRITMVAGIIFFVLVIIVRVVEGA